MNRSRTGAELNLSYGNNGVVDSFLKIYVPDGSMDQKWSGATEELVIFVGLLVLREGSKSPRH